MGQDKVEVDKLSKKPTPISSHPDQSAWSIKDVLFGFQGNFCRTRWVIASRQDMVSPYLKYLTQSYLSGMSLKWQFLLCLQLVEKQLSWVHLDLPHFLLQLITTLDDPRVQSVTLLLKIQIMCGGSAETNIPSRHSSKYKCNYWWMQTSDGSRCQLWRAFSLWITLFKQLYTSMGLFFSSKEWKEEDTTDCCSDLPLLINY